MRAVADYALHLEAVPADLTELSRWTYQQVVRLDFAVPGVAVVRLPADLSSQALRRFMIALKEALSVRHHERTGKKFVYLSMGRFDQQVTTKYHLDGAPAEAYLMLGYEPSAICSELFIADYSRAACETGTNPLRFLDDCNPMYPHNEQRLRPYMRKLDVFEAAWNQVVLFNNSSYASCPDGEHVQGVMHKATILTPDPHHTRTVNSTMIGVADPDTEEAVTPEMQRHFATTDEVAGR